MAEEKRRRGRPVTTGGTPKRNIRVGAVWDEAAAIAERRGETMTDVVKRLLENYVRRHRATTQPTPESPAAPGTPDR